MGRHTQTQRPPPSSWLSLGLDLTEATPRKIRDRAIILYCLIISTANSSYRIHGLSSVIVLEVSWRHTPHIDPFTRLVTVPYPSSPKTFPIAGRNNVRTSTMMEASSTWDSQDPTLSVPSQDDFQQFLDMGMNNLSDNLQFDFPEFNHQQSAQAQLMHQNGAEAMDTRMESGGSTGQDVTMQEHMASMTTTTNHPAIHGGAISNAQSSSDSLTDLDAQIQYLQHQRHQQQQRQMHEQQRNFYSQNQMIPPTPNSMELHSGNAQFYTQSDPQQQAMYERYRMQKEHDVSFSELHCTKSFRYSFLITHSTDVIYSSCISSSDSYGASLQYPGIYYTGSLFQPFELPSFACPK